MDRKADEHPHDEAKPATEQEEGLGDEDHALEAAERHAQQRRAREAGQDGQN
jgi:hypothetical protein